MTLLGQARSLVLQRKSARPPLTSSKQAGFNIWQIETSVSNVSSCCLRHHTISRLVADTWPTMLRLRHYKDFAPTPPGFGLAPWGHHGVGICATLCDMPLLCAASSVRAWTEHIERCWLISAAVLLGVGDDQCKFLGRWPVTASHEEYIRTAARAVCQLQRQVPRAAAADNSLAEIGFKESELEFCLRQAGHDDTPIN